MIPNRLRDRLQELLGEHLAAEVVEVIRCADQADVDRLRAPKVTTKKSPGQR